MDVPIIELLYCSRSRIGGGETADAAIRAILATARRRNGPQAVTGALLFSAHCFAQVLEGPAEVVDRLFGQIEDDPRHADIVVVSRTPIQSRQFPEWSMAFSSGGEDLDRVTPSVFARAFTGADAEVAADLRHLIRENLASVEIW